MHTTAGKQSKEKPGDYEKYHDFQNEKWHQEKNRSGDDAAQDWFENGLIHCVYCFIKRKTYAVLFYLKPFLFFSKKKTTAFRHFWIHDTDNSIALAGALLHSSFD